MARTGKVLRMEETYKGCKIEVYLNTPIGSSITGNRVYPEYLADVDGKDVSQHIRECKTPDAVVAALSRLIDQDAL